MYQTGIVSLRTILIDLYVDKTSIRRVTDDVGIYPICWPGWRPGAEPFGIMAVTQTQPPNCVDQVTIRYVGSTCP